MVRWFWERIMLRSRVLLGIWTVIFVGVALDAVLIAWFIARVA